MHKKLLFLALICLPIVSLAQESERSIRKKQEAADDKKNGKNGPTPQQMSQENLKASIKSNDKKTRKRMEKNLKQARKKARKKAYRNQPKRNQRRK